MRKLLIAIPALTAFFLTGCAVDITPMGKDRYMGSKMGGAFTSVSALTHDVVEAATEFCAKRGEYFEILSVNGHAANSSISTGSGIPSGGGFYGGLAGSMPRISVGSYPESQVIFRCVPRGSEKTPGEGGAGQ